MDNPRVRLILGMAAVIGFGLSFAGAILWAVEGW